MDAPHEESRLYPDHVLIVGGGRWARVLVDVVCGLVPASVTVTIHTRRGTGVMSEWLAARGLAGRVAVDPAWPARGFPGPAAAIIANATRDHASAAARTLAAGLPTIVEKPLALTADEAGRLTEIANAATVPLAAAHVFRFASYLDRFAAAVTAAGQVDSLHIDWADPTYEQRYGESKAFDPGTPVFVDVIPHVMSILTVLRLALPQRCRLVEVRRGGAAITLEFAAGSTPCVVRMERNSEHRRRVVEAFVDGERWSLDFAVEPGVISGAGATMAGDPDWGPSGRPLPAMLRAFFAWIAGGDRDDRLEPEVGVQACRIIDEAGAMYRAMVGPWLSSVLGTGVAREDTDYALAELLQVNGRLPASELERQIDEIRTRRMPLPSV